MTRGKPKNQRKREDASNELVDPGNSKQTKKPKIAKERNAMKQADKTEAMKRNDKGKEISTKISFVEDNEIMDVEVSAAQEEEFDRREAAVAMAEKQKSRDRSRSKSKEKTPEPMNEEENFSEEEGEIVTSRNNNAVGVAEEGNSQSRRSFDDKKDQYEETKEAEYQSMMKFVKFLENRGFIRQRTPSPEKEK